MKSLLFKIFSANNIEKRIKEAEKLGFKKAIIPDANKNLEEKFENIEIVKAKRLIDAITACVSKAEVTTTN